MPTTTLPSALSDDLAAWVRLLATPDVGRGMARQLMARWGNPAAIFDLPKSTLAAVLGPSLAEHLSRDPEGWGEQRAAVSQWLAGDASRHLIALDDARYPRALMHTADPPLLLYVQGRVELLNAPSLAIVGSRNATAQGADHARNFARVLGGCGYTIVSGLALGIDGAAHDGAVDTSGGTVAVVGTGIDRIYPTRHEALARRISSKGLIVSELPLGTSPLRENFPQRNRIIAGLTQGTLVVEAAPESGSLITARMASECGREVFAIPGSIHSPQSRGCHALIKQGAKLVESAEDVMEELSRSHGRPRDLFATDDGDVDALPSEPSRSAEYNPVERAPSRDQAMLNALGHEPVTLDDVLDRTGLDAATAQARLLDLELEGRVQRLPGGRYQRRHVT